MVVAPKAARRDGRFIEILGTYDPLDRNRFNFKIDLERAEYWLSVGAQPSETASSIIRKAKQLRDDPALAESALKEAEKVEKATQEHTQTPPDEDKEKSAAPDAETEAQAEGTATAEPAETASEEAAPEKPADAAEAETEAQPQAEAAEPEKEKAGA